MSSKYGDATTNRTALGLMQVEEYEAEIHYEVKLRESFFSNCTGEGTIND